MARKLLVTGSLNYDVVLLVDHFAPPKSIVKEIRRYLGGSGGNAAVAAAKILGHGNVGMLAALGDDYIGGKHLEELISLGIDVSLIKVFKNVESGQAYVALRTDGENAIYSYRGANDLLLPNTLTNDDLMRVRSYDSLLVMNPPIPTAEYLSSLFSNDGKDVFWDPGALSRAGIKGLAKVIKHTKYLLPNLDELLLMTNTKDLSRAIDVVRELRKDAVIIAKAGLKGSYIVDLSKLRAIKVSSVRTEDLGLKVVSTVGCGDTYSGVFAALINKGLDIIDASELATCAAAIKASRESPRASPTLEELMSFKDKCLKVISVEEFRL